MRYHPSNREVRRSFQKAGFSVLDIDLMSKCEGWVKASIGAGDFLPSCRLLRDTLRGTGWSVVDFGMTSLFANSYEIVDFTGNSLSSMEKFVRDHGIKTMHSPGREVRPEERVVTQFALVTKDPVRLEGNFDAWHVTPTSSVERILSVGLTPRTPNSEWIKEFRSRAVYLSLERPIMEILVESLDHLKVREWSLLKIQGAQDFRMYYDCEYGDPSPRYVYTTQAVPPNRITVEETYSVPEDVFS